MFISEDSICASEYFGIKIYKIGWKVRSQWFLNFFILKKIQAPYMGGLGEPKFDVFWAILTILL